MLPATQATNDAASASSMLALLPLARWPCNALLGTHLFSALPEDDGIAGDKDEGAAGCGTAAGNAGAEDSGRHSDRTK